VKTHPGRLFVTALLAVAALAFLANARSIDPAAHASIMGHLSKVHELDAELDNVVLKLRAGLLSNYDPLVDRVMRIRAHQRELEEGEEAIARVAGEDLARDLAALGVKLAEKEALIERFKSHNAVLANSFHYFPRSMDAVVRDPRTPPAFRNDTQTLVRDLLLLRLEPAATDYETVAMKISRLREQLAGQAPAVRASADVFLRHAQHMLDDQAELDRIVQAVTATSVKRPSDALAEAYGRAFERRLREANIYRLVLVLFSLALLAYAAVAVVGWRAGTAAIRRAAAGEISLAVRRLRRVA